VGTSGDRNEILQGWVGIEMKSTGMGAISVPVHISATHAETKCVVNIA